MADDYVSNLLGRDEIVLIDTRQHWMAALDFALKPILLLLAVVVLFVLNNVLDFDGLLSFINTLVSALLVIGAIAAIIWLPVDLVRWRSRHYVLTNRRVIRLDGVLSKNSFDSSLDKITDIESRQSVLGRVFGYTDLVLYTASDDANEEYDQLMDGLQFKKAVLDAKEALRVGHPLTALPEGFVVSGGTNAASRGSAAPAAEAASAQVEAASAAEAPASAAAPEPAQAPPAPATPSEQAPTDDPAGGSDTDATR